MSTSTDSSSSDMIIIKIKPKPKASDKAKPKTSDKAKMKTKEHYLAKYLAQLTPIEKTVYKIAQEHLETSFSLEKSIGFKEWYDTQQK